MKQTNALNKEWLAALLNGGLEEVIGAQKLSAAKAKAVVDYLILGILDAVNAGAEIKIKNFGSLKCVQTLEKPGRNPKTGEALKIPARKKLKFKASKETEKIVE